MSGYFPDYFPTSSKFFRMWYCFLKVISSSEEPQFFKSVLYKIKNSVVTMTFPTYKKITQNFKQKYFKNLLYV